MREILFLLLLSMPLVQCNSPSPNSPMESILTKDSLHDKMMTFLVRTACTSPTTTYKTSKVDFLGLKANGLVTPFNERGAKRCSDAIGFLPISKEKVQVFVTANNKYLMKDPANSRAIEQIDLIFKATQSNSDEIVVTCKPDSNGKWKTEKGPSFNLFKVSDLVDRFLHGESYLATKFVDGGNIIQFQSFYLEKCADNNCLDLSQIMSGIWTLSVKLVDDPAIVAMQPAEKAKEMPNSILYTGTLGADDLFKKMRCDPEKLVLPPVPEVPGFIYGTLGKDKPTENLNYYEGDQAKPFFLTSINECPYTMTYKGETDQTTGKLFHASKVFCKESTSGWNYVATGYTDKDKVNQGTIEFAVDETVEVECLQRKCTMCGPPAHGSACYGTRCTPIDHKAGFDEDCSVLELSKCASGISRFNDKKFEKHTPADVKCDAEGKYMVPANFKNSGNEIHNASCAELFSRGQSELDHVAKNESVALGTVDPEKPADCGNICACKLGRRLAIANSDLTSWLRVETLIFDNNTGEWTYTRKHKDGGMKTHKLGEGKQGEDRPFACVLDAPDSRSEAQKDALRKNPTKNIVIVVNLIILAVLVGATIPAVIYYVNSQIKKREAKKAAKKDKKKEEQSGDKKDGEPKKDEEKKNEA